VIECYTQWQYKPPDEDLTSYNPTEGPFSCIHDAFDSSIDLEKILLDAVTLPQDNCQAISIAITKGTARAISDGSYNPLTHKGTSSLTIVADKHGKDPLNGDNWVPGLLTDQSAYRSELAGIAGILSAAAVIIKQYNIISGSITIGEVRVEPRAIAEIYNWDGQTSGPRTDGDADFLAIKLV
jgi:hypothetical protein